MRKMIALALLLSTAACTTLQPVANPTVFMTNHHPAFLVVTTADSGDPEEALVFQHPTLAGGTLTGLVLNEETSVPVTQVRTVLARQVDRRRTTMAVVLGGAIVGGIGYLMTQHGDGPASRFYDPSCGHQTQCYKPDE